MTHDCPATSQRCSHWPDMNGNLRHDDHSSFARILGSPDGCLLQYERVRFRVNHRRPFASDCRKHDCAQKGAEISDTQRTSGILLDALILIVVMWMRFASEQVTGRIISGRVSGCSIVRADLRGSAPGNFDTKQGAQVQYIALTALLSFITEITWLSRYGTRKIRQCSCVCGLTSNRWEILTSNSGYDTRDTSLGRIRDSSPILDPSFS
jgi:hypothetical protein